MVVKRPSNVSGAQDVPLLLLSCALVGRRVLVDKFPLCSALPVGLGNQISHGLLRVENV